MLNQKTIADAYFPLFELMQNEFNLTLLVSDMNEIINAVDVTKTRISGLLKWTMEENKISSKQKAGKRLTPISNDIYAWNSVINSIPHDTATKIIVTDEGVVTTGWHWNGKGCGWKGDFIGTVTHWIDLPKPPALLGLMKPEDE